METSSLDTPELLRQLFRWESYPVFQRRKHLSERLLRFSPSDQLRAWQTGSLYLHECIQRILAQRLTSYHLPEDLQEEETEKDKGKRLLREWWLRYCDYKRMEEEMLRCQTTCCLQEQALRQWMDKHEYDEIQSPQYGVLVRALPGERLRCFTL